MELNNVLENIGLKEGEIKVYLDLLKYGQSSVAKIKERTQLHRTTIYDFLESLINKGLVGYIVISSVKHYNAKDPQNLFVLLEEKKNQLENVFEEFNKIKSTYKSKFSVEILKGKEGVKFWVQDIIDENKDVIGFGIDDHMTNEILHYEALYYYKQKKNFKFQERLLTKMSAKFLYRDSNYRFLPDKYFNPTSTMVYGNKVAILIWEPLCTILIENEELADSYRKTFELLWKIAKPYEKLSKNKKQKIAFDK